MKIVILGASGYLGTLLVNSLSKTNRVIALSRKNSDLTYIEEHSNVSIIRDESSNWTKYIVRENPDVVIAAHWSGVKKSERNNPQIQESNLMLQKDIASVVSNSKIRTFITFGSQAEFHPSTENIPELQSMKSPNEYGRVKSELLSELQGIYFDSETRFIWARVFSVYGPSDRSDSLVNGVIEATQNQQNYDVQNPNTWWSFLFEEDFCLAIQTMIENERISGIVNVGSTQLIKLEKFVNLDFKSSTNQDLEDVILEPGYYPNLEKLNAIGWSPKTSFEDGFEITLKIREQHFEEAFLD